MKWGRSRVRNLIGKTSRSLLKVKALTRFAKTWRYCSNRERARPWRCWLYGAHKPRPMEFQPPPLTRVEPHITEYSLSVCPYFLASISRCRLSSKDRELCFSRFRVKNVWRRRQIQNDKIYYLRRLIGFVGSQKRVFVDSTEYSSEQLDFATSLPYHTQQLIACARTVGLLGLLEFAVLRAICQIIWKAWKL